MDASIRFRTTRLQSDNACLTVIGLRRDMASTTTQQTINEEAEPSRVARFLPSRESRPAMVSVLTLGLLAAFAFVLLPAEHDWSELGIVWAGLVALVAIGRSSLCLKSQL